MRPLLFAACLVAGASGKDLRDLGEAQVATGNGAAKHLRKSSTFPNVNRVIADALQASGGADSIIGNLEPTAPADAVTGWQDSAFDVQDAGVYSGPPRQLGERNALYVPPYLYPDAFPTTAKFACQCKDPVPDAPTPQQLEWAEKVAKQLGVKLADVLSPSPSAGSITTCDCGGSAPAAGGTPYRFVRATPTGDRQYTLSAADGTVGNGNYWVPSAAPGGVVAPLDRLPESQYPAQALGDVSDPSAAVAVGDRVPEKLARYMDQVQARSDANCVGDNCGVACAAGDTVSLALGNLAQQASIVRKLPGGMFEVSYSPVLMDIGSVTTACSLQAGCSMFHPCKSNRPGMPCVAQQVQEDKINFGGSIDRSMACPAGTKACSTLNEMISTRFLSKNGSPCRIQ